MELDISKLREEFDGPHKLITTSDNKTLFLRAWNPEQTSKEDIAILILHGITAYSCPYNQIGENLANKGFYTYGLDLRGHGLSDGNRGDYPSSERLINDLREALSFVKKDHAVVVLLGHSLGVFSSVIASIHCPDLINGAILLSAALSTRPGIYPTPSIFKKLMILVSSLILPNRPVIVYRREGMVGLDDPLFNFKYTLRFMKIFSHKGLELPEKFAFPILMGIGDQDELFTVEAARELFNDINCDNKEFFVVKGAKHAEFPEGSLSPLVEWLQKIF